MTKMKRVIKTLTKNRCANAGVSASSLVALQAQLAKAQQDAQLIKEGKLDADEMRLRWVLGAAEVGAGRSLRGRLLVSCIKGHDHALVLVQPACPVPQLCMCVPPLQAQGWRGGAAGAAEHGGRRAQPEGQDGSQGQ